MTIFKSSGILQFLTLALTVLLISCTSVKQTDKVNVEITDFNMPVLLRKDHNKVAKLTVQLNDSTASKTLVGIELEVAGDLPLTAIKNISVLSDTAATVDFKKAKPFGSVSKAQQSVSIKGNLSLSKEPQNLWISMAINQGADITKTTGVVVKSLEFKDGSTLSLDTTKSYISKLGIALRNKGDDNVHTYRIPGLATTNKGTLIAVYDIRYNSSVDLQAHVDVGISRSTDGGQTWEPMEVIMDMGTYGGLPQDENGIGDPAVLVDKNTGTIWVAALWLHGKKDKRAWWASEEGLSPEQTGQFMLVKSEDDGKTWSKPINVTKQMKDPSWNLFFNGPGNGITMKDGTLVFAAQFKDENAVPHSTIVYSKDGGKNWEVGTGAKSHTTEAQVVELSDGSLMLNMRDDRNRRESKDTLNGRSVAITKDLGKTWTEHPTSRKALIEPNCMASIISFERDAQENVLFFSNPNSKVAREHMTIKASLDQGSSWPKEKQVEIFEQGGYGYSCLTQIDKNYIGILYEGSGDLYFQKIAVKSILE
jgi:sialidase-1